MVIERPLAKKVAREQKLSCLRVPQRKCEVADQSLERGFVPAIEAGKQDPGVAQLGRRDRGDSECRTKLVAIVQPDVGDQCEAVVGAVQRLPIERILGYSPIEPAPQ